MSEFLAEARVLVRPDVTRFRAELTAQLNALKIAPVTVPIVAGASGVAGIAGISAVLSNAQRGLVGTTTQLDTATRVANTSWAKQAVLLGSASAETLRYAGAQDVAAAATAKATATQAGFRKGLLASLASLTGLRGAVLAASGPFLAGAIAAAAFTKSLALFAEFETQLNVFAATTGATADEMERVSESARQLGADITLPAVGAADAAAAMTELAKAGLSVEDTLAGARGVLQLSTAANIGVAEAAEFAANALNSFGLAGDQATRVADVLANASNSAQGSIQDFGIAFQQASAVARQVGFSLEETATTLTILAQNGLRGSDAGTSLRVALLRLVNPTAKAAEVIGNLGIEIRDAQGNIRPDVFVQFGEATRNLGPAMRDAALATVFGADAIRAVAIASREGRSGLLEVTEQMNQQGTAAELAEARTRGFGGQTEALKNTLATTGIAVGQVSSLLAGPLVLSINAVVTAINSGLGPLATFTERLKGIVAPDFDPTTASVSELLERMKEVQKAFEQQGGEAQFPTLLRAIREAIEGFKQQRAQLKALGIDVTGVDITIKELTKDYDELLKAGTGAAKEATEGLSPLQERAKELREAIASAGEGFDTAPLKKTLREIDLALLDAAEKARFRGHALAQNFNAGAAEIGKPVRNIIQELTEEALDIEIAGGGTDATISNLRAQEAHLRDRIEALSGAPLKRQEAKEELVRVLDKIESIQESETRDVETRAREISAKALDSDRAVADALVGKRGRLENLISRAAGTEGLKDDIRFTTALRALIQRQIDEARKRIKDVEIRKAFIDASNRLLIQLLQDIKRDKQQMARDAAAALEDQRANIIQGIRLDIELAQTNENVRQEIRKRQQLIRALKQAQSRVKQGTNEWKRLRNEIREEQKAIEELRDQKQDSSNAFRELAFQFLQTQQGFAANLLGNLIPAGVTGLSGGGGGGGGGPLIGAGAGGPGAASFGGGLGGALIQEAGLSSGKAGPSSGQLSELIEINRQMARLLSRIAGDAKHPEAKRSKMSSRAMLDILA